MNLVTDYNDVDVFGAGHPIIAINLEPATPQHATVGLKGSRVRPVRIPSTTSRSGFGNGEVLPIANGNKFTLCLPLLH